MDQQEEVQESGEIAPQRAIVELFQKFAIDHHDAPPYSTHGTLIRGAA